MKDVLAVQRESGEVVFDNDLDAALGLHDYLAAETARQFGAVLDEGERRVERAAAEIEAKIRANLRGPAELLADLDRGTSIEAYAALTAGNYAVNLLWREDGSAAIIPELNYDSRRSVAQGSRAPGADTHPPASGPALAKPGLPGTDGLFPTGLNGAPGGAPGEPGAGGVIPPPGGEPSPPPPGPPPPGEPPPPPAPGWYVVLICNPVTGSWSKVCVTETDPRVGRPDFPTFGPFPTEGACLNFQPPPNSCPKPPPPEPPSPPPGWKSCPGVRQTAPGDYVVETNLTACRVMIEEPVEPLGPVVLISCGCPEGKFVWARCVLPCGKTKDDLVLPDGWRAYAQSFPAWFDEALYRELRRGCVDLCPSQDPPPPKLGDWWAIARCDEKGRPYVDCVKSETMPKLKSEEKLLGFFASEAECKKVTLPLSFVCPGEPGGEPDPEPDPLEPPPRPEPPDLRKGMREFTLTCPAL